MTKTINGLTVTTSAAAGDFLAIWRAANGDTRKITKADFMGSVLTGSGTISGGGTLATGGFTATLTGTSTINGSLVGNISGGGTLATGGFTGTLSATGTIAVKSVVVGARAYSSINLSIPDAIETAVLFNNERYDTDLIHSISTNTSRFIAPVAGKYLITASIAFAANSTGSRHIGIKYNGTTLIAYNAAAAQASPASTRFTISAVYHLALSDYLEIVVYQDSGGALNILTLANYSPEVSMMLLGNA